MNVQPIKERKVWRWRNIAPYGSGLCVVALSINLKLTTTLDRGYYAKPLLCVSKIYGL